MLEKTLRLSVFTPGCGKMRGKNKRGFIPCSEAINSETPLIFHHFTAAVGRVETGVIVIVFHFISFHETSGIVCVWDPTEFMGETRFCSLCWTGFSFLMSASLCRLDPPHKRPLRDLILRRSRRIWLPVVPRQNKSPETTGTVPTACGTNTFLLPKQGAEKGKTRGGRRKEEEEDSKGEFGSTIRIQRA